MAKNFYEKISIGAGGIVGRCQECKKMNVLRFVTETVNMCPSLPSSWKDVQTYRLCDRCADCEKRRFESNGGEVVDGRDMSLKSEFLRPEKPESILSTDFDLTTL